MALSRTAGALHVTVSSATLATAAERALEDLIHQGIPDALAGKDATLWGEEATAEASIRLGWLDLPESSRSLLPRLGELQATLRDSGVERIVLAGMGGSSLAPEVITRTAEAPLVVLDTTDPGQVRRAIETDLERTAVVVASKSGSTLETDSHRRAFVAAFEANGIEAARRVVVVTDPDSPLDALARSAGYHVVHADPNVGGRYSALTAFGLVPSALAGADVTRLLDEARTVQATLVSSDSSSLLLGAALGAAAVAGHDKLVIADTGSGIAGFGDWAEQLIAESTGKQGKGILPVVVEGVDAPGFIATANTHLVGLGSKQLPDATTVEGSLGAQFLGWEFATAVAGRIIGINPFDQPNVAESKANTAEILDQWSGDEEPTFIDDAIAVYADEPVGSTLPATLDWLIRSIEPSGYLAVMAYLDRQAEPEVASIRGQLARAAERPVTFGWGPRFLHSTGQYHKGGPANGSFLQITGAVERDYDIPGRPFTFGTLQLAQALGDLRALRSRQRPAVRLHLRDRAAGIRQLLDAVQRQP